MIDFWFNAFKTLFITNRPNPAEFRRGKHRTGRHVPDLNSKHIGTFKGGITPMKRRFKGVSRTAGKQ